MNKNAFAKVLKSTSLSTSDRLIVSDMPGNQWYEIPVDGRATVERDLFGVNFELHFKPADEFLIPFYPEHVYWVCRGGISAGRLLLRVAIHKQSCGDIVVRFRSERNARTQWMRACEFTTDPDLREARTVAVHTEQEFLAGFSAYDQHLHRMFPEDWERITKACAEAKREGWL